MRTVTVSALLFLLLLILVSAQAIRLPPEFTSYSSSQGKLQEEANWVGSSTNKGVVLCEDEHCSGDNRKTMTNTRSTLESTKGERVEEKPAPSHHESHNNFDTKRQDLSVKPTYPETTTTTTKYPDAFDLAGMDYSPARRKPPIHN